MPPQAELFTNLSAVDRKLSERYATDELHIYPYKVSSSKDDEDVPLYPLNFASVKSKGKLYTGLRPWLKELKNHLPGFALVLVDHVATKGFSRGEQTFELSLGKADKITYARNKLIVNIGKFLWHGFSPHEDARKSWLEAVGVVTYHDGKPSVPLYFPRDAVSVPTHDNQHTAFKTFEIDRSLAPRIASLIASNRFKLKWTVRTALKFYNGYSSEGSNVVIIARRVEWTTRTADEIIETCVHEIGHRMGLVPAKGEPPFLATSPTHDSGHEFHCNKPDCVMYYCSGGKRTDEFCSDCRRILKRTDLSWASGVYGRNIA